MTKKRGEIEEWLKRIKWGGHQSDYIVYIRYRRSGDNTEELKPIFGDEIDDVRRGYIVSGGEYIPFHRVEEIRTRNGRIVYSRRGGGSKK
ncbi:DUF504 domain-containing protein [Desulfurococcaceae archaeon MEX13E-LK6-19]|nr:DUF504 domain-containing protein [Desulfurococcaceae archaeon MEX13E-LK6-19]